MRAWLWLLVVGCSEYNVGNKDINTPGETDSGTAGNDSATPGVGQVALVPEEHDFGNLAVGDRDTVVVEITNVGDGDLTVSSVDYTADDGALSFTALDQAIPTSLQPQQSMLATVQFAPADAGTFSGALKVTSDDPDQPIAHALQQGVGISPETRCYILDDGIAHETTSSPDHVVDSHGDPDLYWYEPSGQHGMLASDSDFDAMVDHIASQATSETVTWPLSFQSDSTLATFSFATFTYVMCSFWVPEDTAPDDYGLSIGAVDDGVQILLNGEIIDYLTLGNSGSWSLSTVVPGDVNTVIITLVDDSAVNRYMNDMILTHQGVPLD